MSCNPRRIENAQNFEIKPETIHKIIKEILTCNICLQIFNDPVNIKNCLHKFCRRCIEDFNRRIKKECAICRHGIETRRLLREDMKIKEIIHCLIPNIDKYNEAEEIMFQQCLKKSISVTPYEAAMEKLEKTTSNEAFPRNNSSEINYNNIPSIPSGIQELQKMFSESQLFPHKSEQTFLEKKTSRDPVKDSSNEIGIFKITQRKCLSELNKNISLGIKIYSFTDNIDFSKVFSKIVKIRLTKHIPVSNETIPVELIAKFISKKLDLPEEESSKIRFVIKDVNNRVLAVPQSSSILSIMTGMNRYDKSDELNVYFQLNL